MKIFKLKRFMQTDEATFGVLTNGEQPLCNTLELPWKDNQRNISCIPAGEYFFEERYSDKFDNHWLIKNVVGRSYILIHVGNTTNDIEGCILVGRRWGSLHGKPAVLESGLAMAELHGDRSEKYALGKEGLLIVENCYGKN